MRWLGVAASGVAICGPEVACGSRLRRRSLEGDADSGTDEGVRRASAG